MRPADVFWSIMKKGREKILAVIRNLNRAEMEEACAEEGLMVDYSCAIKLSTPICVISAMREAITLSLMMKTRKPQKIRCEEPQRREKENPFYTLQWQANWQELS